MQKCAFGGYRKEVTIKSYSLATSSKLDWMWEFNLVSCACVMTLHDHDTDTNDDMTTATDFHTEHIHTNTWVNFILFFLCQPIVVHAHAPHGSSRESCVHLSSHPHSLMKWATLIRLWSPLSLHAPPVALLPLLPALEARWQPAARSAQWEYGLVWRDLPQHS